MHRRFAAFIAVAVSIGPVFSQPQQPSRGGLEVETIMRDPAWMGTSPSSAFWSEDGKKVYFEWRRERDGADSLYEVSALGGVPKPVPFEQRRILPARTGDYTKDRKRKTYVRDGDVFLLDIPRNREIQLTKTADSESGARFSFDGQCIVFERDGNIFKRDLAIGLEEQLTQFVRGVKPGEDSKTESQNYVGQEALGLSQVLRERKAKKDDEERDRKAQIGRAHV